MLLRLPDTKETHESPFGGVGFRCCLPGVFGVVCPEDSEIDGFQGKFHDFRSCELKTGWLDASPEELLKIFHWQN